MDNLPVIIKDVNCTAQTINQPSWAYRSSLAFLDLKLNHPKWCLITPFAFQTFVNHKNTLSKLKVLLSHSQSAAAEKINHLLTTQPFPHALKHELSAAVRWCGPHLLRLTPASSQSPLPPFANTIFSGDAVLADLLRHWWAFHLVTARSPQTPLPSGWVPPLILSAVPEPQFQGVLYTQNPHTLEKNSSYGELSFAWFTSPLKTPPTRLTFTHTDSGQLTFSPFPDRITMLVRTRHGDFHLKSAAPSPLSWLKPRVSLLFPLARSLQNHFFRPLMLRFTFSHNRIFITHAQPLVDSFAPSSFPSPTRHSSARLLLTGQPSGGGLVTAPALVLKDITRVNKPLKPGSILFTPHFPLSQTPLLHNLKGLVTQTGGSLSHLAILTREYGLPGVMGVDSFPSEITSGQLVTINGTTGAIYLGSLPPSPPPKPPVTARYPATKIFFAANHLDRLNPVLTHRFDGIGLVRGEVFVSSLGFHPLAIPAHRARTQQFSQLVISTLTSLASAVNPLPITYKLTDFSPHDRTELRSAQSYETGPANQVLGDRGLSWLLAHPEFLNLELTTLKTVFPALAPSPFNLLLPFVRDPSEIVAFRRHFARHFGHTRQISLFLSIDTPATAVSLQTFASTHLDGFVLNLNHLSLLALGLDPQTSFFNLSLPIPGLNLLIANAITQALDLRLPIHLSLPVPQPDLLDLAVKAGLTGVIINPSHYPVIKDTLVNIEKKIVS